ncbi:MAG TPA: hypothetical protein VEI03_07955 [Stellaceae bacterium]|nr:hypothetical protein [Stellaceae bacterium]
MCRSAEIDSENSTPIPVHSPRYVLENGRIITDGAAAAPLADDRVQLAYIGL